MFSVLVTCCQKCQIIFCRHSKSLENHEKGFEKLLEYPKVFCKIFCGHPVKGLPQFCTTSEMRGRTEITIVVFWVQQTRVKNNAGAKAFFSSIKNL